MSFSVFYYTLHTDEVDIQEKIIGKNRASKTEYVYIKVYILKKYEPYIMTKNTYSNDVPLPFLRHLLPPAKVIHAE
jgi:hypothetical protein